MRKVLAIVSFTAISLGAWSVASADGTVKSKEECPPVKHHRHHHKPVHHHPHARHHMAPQKHCEPVSCAPCPLICSGFFGGIKGGYALGRSKLRANSAKQAVGLLQVTDSHRGKFAFDGGEVGLFLGYDHYFPNKWVLGLEGGAQWTDLTGKATTFSSVGSAVVGGVVLPAATISQRTRLKSDWSFDVAVRLGHKIFECSTFYVKAGAQFTHFKLRTNSIQTNLATGATNRGAPHAHHKKYRTGFLAGAGVEVPVICHLSLGAEYNFTWYQRISTRRNSRINSDFIRAKVRPYESQFIAKVIWKQ
jgi:opacity protein-like surface antigen